MKLLVAALAGLVPLTTAAAAAASSTASSLPLPSQDPFYQPTSDYAHKQPGAILKTRVADLVADNFRQNHNVSIRGAWQFLYRTTDALQKAAVAVTTLVVPEPYNASQILSSQVPYDSADLNCAPSYFLAVPNNPGKDDNFTQAAGILAEGLQRGWIAAIPDFEGVDSAFGVGPAAARAVLDGLRVVLSSEAQTGVRISPNAVVQAAGYSGGGHATEWTNEYLASYAPDVLPKWIGSAAGGQVVNVSNTLVKIDGGVAASLIPRALLGIAHQYADIAAYFDKHLIPARRDAFYSAEHCDNPHDFTDEHILTTYLDTGDAFLSSPEFTSFVETAGVMGFGGRPTKPLYMWHGGKDDLVPVQDVDALYKKYCDEGVIIEYVRNPNTMHVEEGIIGIPKALEFLADRFAGKEWITACEQLDIDA